MFYFQISIHLIILLKVCFLQHLGATDPETARRVHALETGTLSKLMAKAKGKDSFTLYDDEINEKMLEKLNLEVEMRKIQNS